MSRWSLCASALLLPWAIACAGTEPTKPGTAQLPPGCFRLTLGAWSAPHEAVDPPPYLSLMDSVGTAGLEHGQHLVRGVPLPTQPYPWMWWSAASSDSLRLVFTGGFVGVDVHLARRASTWDGLASAFTDVAPSTQATTGATLAPAACPP